VEVARDAAMLGRNAEQGLSTLVSGLLQSMNFLYRFETNALDPDNGRLKYDGRSMAVRLAYFLTGGPPSAELLLAGESGQLDTAEGVQAAAASMLNDGALVGQLTSFFQEYTQADLVMSVQKDSAMFPEFNDSLKSSMLEGTRLFLEKVVLAPGADVRSFFDSDQTFADAALAPIYGLTPPASGFAEFTLAPESDRAGIMGQAAILAARSRASDSGPTFRGLFMMQAFFCQAHDAGKPYDPYTTREELELATSDAACSGCHAEFEPMGFALEHFDAIGRYRETDNGVAIDTRGSFADGTTFDGARELGAALRGSRTTTECLLRHFYRSVNGRMDDEYDMPQVAALGVRLGARNYVFRDLIADFVISDAFRSAPAVPLTEEDQ
jgi:hypothetical protein